MEAIKLNEIGYMPLPKVACTSIKNAIFNIKFNRDYDSKIDDGNHIHQFWEQNRENISSCKHRLIVVRDPIKRLLSSYSNRVDHHKELSFEKMKWSNPKIAGSFDIYNPGLGQFIDNFEQYYRINSIYHHSKPVVNWFDGGLEQFTKVYKIEETNSLQNDLSELLNLKVEFRRDQTGGRKIPIQDLNRSQVEFLMEFYRKDYELLRDYYSFDSFWKEWKSGI